MGLLDNQTQKAYYEGSDFGAYQFVSLSDVINNFLITYVGKDKLISRMRRTDVAFHAQRALAELSFDTFKSTKSQEIEVPSSLLMTLPQDYVNYVKLSWSDASGIKHVLYPAIKTSNPFAIKQNTNGTYDFDSGTVLQEQDATDHVSDTWDKYKSSTSSENQKDDFNYDDDNYDLNIGQRYGIDPQHAQVNGSFYIDELQGRIHFSSNVSGKTVILDYISDSLGTDDEMKVHKLAEDAMYKHMLCDVMSSRRGVSVGAMRYYKKDKFAAVRKAKLRLSNIKIEEITQILRGKSKHIKH